MTKPAFLKPDNFPLAQVVLILYTMAAGVIAILQVVAFFSIGPMQVTLPANVSPISVYLLPAVQNIFFAAGMATLAHQLSVQYHKLLWRIAVAVISMQVIITALQLAIQFSLGAMLYGVLGLFGLASLLIGRDDADVAIPVATTAEAISLPSGVDSENKEILPATEPENMEQNGGMRSEKLG